MDQEKLKAIKEYVNGYIPRLTGHWSENDKQMLFDLLKGYEELEENNKALAAHCNSWMDKADEARKKYNDLYQKYQELEAVKIIKNGRL